MRKTFLVMLMLVLVATPCFAQEIEADGYLALEGTLWLALDRDEYDNYIGFDKGEIYTITKQPDDTASCAARSQLPSNTKCYYTTLPFLAMFIYEDQYMEGKYFDLGLMLPHLSIGLIFSNTVPIIFPQVAIKVNSNWVFSKEDGSRYSGWMRKSLETARKRTGIPRFTLHDLRHTFASHLVMEGVDLPTVQKLLGHSKITTTMIYAHLAPDHLKNAMHRLSLRFNNNGTIMAQSPKINKPTGC